MIVMEHFSSFKKAYSGFFLYYIKKIILCASMLVLLFGLVVIFVGIILTGWISGLRVGNWVVEAISSIGT
jgi:hypothetical protein